MGSVIILESDFAKYLKDKRQSFEEVLLQEATIVRDSIEEILKIGNIDLINNAHLLVGYIIHEKEQELQSFAKQEGIAWATHSIPLSLKIEWVQAIRRTLWYFVEEYTEINNDETVTNFFAVEKQLNRGMDRFLYDFFIEYSSYKDRLLNAQKALVEDLSVPIIPITASICILPLIGRADDKRMRMIQEKVLMEISNQHIQTLIIDLSGIADMETNVVDELMKITSGAGIMGCTSVLTGLRADVVRKIVDLGITFNSSTKTVGTLQQALRQYIVL